MKPQLWILVFLVSLSAVMAVLFAPALPLMATSFNVSNDRAQLLMTIFLFGYAIGQLIYGPIAKALGRKPAITIGCLLTILGSVICIFSAYFLSFSWMLLGRVITALGSAAGLTLSFTLISDTYRANQARKIISYIMLSFGVIPGIALIAGGYITEYLGWQSCFIAMLIYAVFIMGISRFLPETLSKRDHSHLRLSNITKAYIFQLKQPYLVISGILMGLSTATFYLFQAEGPFIGIEKIGMPVDIYGLLAFIPAVGLSLGALISGFYSNKLSYKRANKVFISLYFITSVSMFVFFSIGIITWYTLFIPPFLLLLIMITIYSFSSAHALDISTDKAHASALMQGVNLLTASFMILLLSVIPSSYITTLPIIYVINSILMIICFVFLLNIYRKKEAK